MRKILSPQCIQVDEDGCAYGAYGVLRKTAPFYLSEMFLRQNSTWLQCKVHADSIQMKFAEIILLVAGLFCE